MKIRPLFLSFALCLLLIDRAALWAHEAAQPGEDIVDQLVRSLSPREKIGQLFVVGFQGAQLTPETGQFIREHQVGGVFLSRDNCNITNGTAHDPKHCQFPDEANPDTPAQVAGLSQELQKASCEATKGSLENAAYCLPLFITVDHEGDDRPLTRILNRFTPIPSNMAIGATFDPSQAESVGCAIGQELAAVGVNMLFGPDLDVLESPISGGPGDQGIRVFGGDPLWVAEMGGAYARGMDRCSGGSLATVAKHFPGHGRSTRGVDVEDVPVVVGKSLQELAQVDLSPFAAVARGKPEDPGVTDAIMNSHLSYPGVSGCDERTPVTFSPGCMQAFFGLPDFTAWREAGGLTVADDLAAGAVQAYAREKFGTYSQTEIALEGLLAGNDLLPLIRPWQWQALGPTLDFLVSRYETDQAVRVRVDDAVRRVLALKERLYPRLDAAAVQKAPASQDAVGQSESAGQVAAIASAALTFIRPGNVEEFMGTVPAPTVSQRILFVECWDDPACAPPKAEDAPGYPPLWPRGKLAALAAEMFPGRVSAGNLGTVSFSQISDLLRGSGDGQVKAAVEQADWLIFALLEYDPIRFPSSEALKEFLRTGRSAFDLRDKKVAVFAFNSPYHLDAGEIRNADLFIAFYSKIEPALRASLKALFQDATVFRDAGGRGSLPVDYIFGNYVLYDLSEQVEPEPSQSVELTVEPENPPVGEEFTVSLAKPLRARNGHRVANGTAVDFTFELPDGSRQQVSAVTTDGLASASVTSPQSGEVRITISSGELQWSPDEPIAVVQGGAGARAQGNGGGELPLVLVVSIGAAAPVAIAALAFVLYQGRRRRLLRSTLERLLPLRAEDEQQVRMRASPLGTVTILFSDIEGSTAMTQRMGDEEAQKLLREHNRILREQIGKYGGYEVKSMGDGFMVAFQSTTNAVACAVGMQRSLASQSADHPERPIRVRIGLNTGETIGEAGDYFGTAVTVAARIAAAAHGNQILVSGLVRELAGSVGGIEFVDAGQIELKGMPGHHHVYEVLWEKPAGPAA